MKNLRDFGVVNGNLALILLTHADFDHSGNAAFLKKQFGCKIAVHPLEMIRIAGRDMTLDRKGIPAPAKPFLPLIFRFNKEDQFLPDIQLLEDVDLNAFGFPGCVVEIPGHTSGSIGILTDDGNFFCGDLLVNRRKVALNRLADNPEAMRQSVKKVSELPCDRIYPGHGEPFKKTDLQFFVKRSGQDE